MSPTKFCCSTLGKGLSKGSEATLSFTCSHVNRPELAVGNRAWRGMSWVLGKETMLGKITVIQEIFMLKIFVCKFCAKTFFCLTKIRLTFNYLYTTCVENISVFGNYKTFSLQKFPKLWCSTFQPSLYGISIVWAFFQKTTLPANGAWSPTCPTHLPLVSTTIQPLVYTHCHIIQSSNWQSH